MTDDRLIDLIEITVVYLIIYWLKLWYPLNTLRPRQNSRHFPNDIFKCIFLNENVEFLLKFQWSLFPRVQFTIFQHWFRQWLGAVQATSHYLNQWWLVYWCIYASPGLNELKVWKPLITNISDGEDHESIILGNACIVDVIKCCLLSTKGPSKYKTIHQQLHHQELKTK